MGCILEDDHSNLWMSTNKGIARFDPRSASVNSYSTAEGLPGPDLTGWGACFKNRSGEMFFGGFNGATFFHPDSVADPSYAPPVVLTEFRLSGSPVDIGAGSPLSKSITYTSRLTLSHEQRIFSLAFSALSYLSPGTNRYRYKLEGLDDTWHEVGSNERLATYTTLPVGVYTFRVQGATSRGKWSDPGAAVMHRDPSSVVEHMVVSCALRCRCGDAAWRILSMAHSATPAPGKASARRCGNNSGDGIFLRARRVR